MAIFALCGTKGGSGRSTISEHLTVWLARQGADVLAVDADDQATLANFTTWREHTLDGAVGYTLVQLTGANVRKQVETMRPKYDHVVIDVGGRDTTSQRAALYIADVALIPIQPRSHDVWTLDKLTEMLSDVQATRSEPLAVRSFLNRADITSADNRETAAVLTAIPDLGFISHAIKNRKAYPNAASKGLTVFEMENLDQKAIQEIEQLFKHITSHVSLDSTTTAH